MKIAVIEVAEYILPTLEVFIESDDHFTLEDKKVQAYIRAEYPNGKPVKGKATINVIEEDNFGYFRYRRESQCTNPEETALLKRIIDIDGRTLIEYDIERELKFDRSEKNMYFDVKNFKISVDVTESVNGFTESAEKTVKVHKNTYDVTTDLTSDALKRDSTVDVMVNSIDFQSFFSTVLIETYYIHRFQYISKMVLQSTMLMIRTRKKSK